MIKSKNQVNNHRFPVLLGLLLGFSLVMMIPISDTVLAKPIFDRSSVGIGCSKTYNEVMNLRAKKAREGLTQAEESQLGAAESNYNDICAGIYGSLPREAPSKPKISDIPLSNNMGVILEDEQPPTNPMPPISNNEGVASENEQQQPLNNPKSQDSVLDANISNTLE